MGHALERGKRAREREGNGFSAFKRARERSMSAAIDLSFLSPRRRQCCCLMQSPLLPLALSLPATPRRGSAGRGGRPARVLRGRLPRRLRGSRARQERGSFVCFFLCLSLESEGVPIAERGRSFFLSSQSPAMSLLPLFLQLPPPRPLSLNNTAMRAAALAPSPRSASALSSAAAPRRASAVAPLAAKPTKAADFRGLSNAEIDTAVAESKRALFDMRIAQKTRQVRILLSHASLRGCM